MHKGHYCVALRATNDMLHVIQATMNQQPTFPCPCRSQGQKEYLMNHEPVKIFAGENMIKKVVFWKFLQGHLSPASQSFLQSGLCQAVEKMMHIQYPAKSETQSGQPNQ